MSQSKDQAVIYITNWLIQHKNNSRVRDTLNILKILNEEDRLNDKRFVGIVESIMDSFSKGNGIQRNLFGFIEAFEFRKIVSDRIADVDVVYEMSDNFKNMLGNVSFRRL